MKATKLIIKKNHVEAMIKTVNDRHSFRLQKKETFETKKKENKVYCSSRWRTHIFKIQRRNLIPGIKNLYICLKIKVIETVNS